MFVGKVCIPLHQNSDVAVGERGGGCRFTFYQLLKIKFYIGWNKRQTVTLCANGKNNNYCQMKFEFKQIITLYNVYDLIMLIFLNTMEITCCVLISGYI